MHLLGPIILFVFYLFFQDLANRAEAEAAELAALPPVSDVYVENATPGQFEVKELQFLKAKKVEKDESSIRYFIRVRDDRVCDSLRTPYQMTKDEGDPPTSH